MMKFLWVDLKSWQCFPWVRHSRCYINSCFCNHCQPSLSFMLCCMQLLLALLKLMLQLFSAFLEFIQLCFNCILAAFLEKLMVTCCYHSIPLQRSLSLKLNENVFLVDLQVTFEIGSCAVKNQSPHLIKGTTC